MWCAFGSMITLTPRLELSKPRCDKDEPRLTALTPEKAEPSDQSGTGGIPSAGVLLTDEMKRRARNG